MISLRRAAAVIAVSALSIAGLPAAGAAVPAAPTAGSKTYTFPQLVESVPAVDPLYVGYKGTEQFIPRAVAMKKDARGCVLRQRMIISLATVKPKVGKGCRMKGGTWVVNGGTRTVKSPKGLKVGPVISYKEAWGQGAYAWTPEQRLAWATNTGTGASVRATGVSLQNTQGIYLGSMFAATATIANWIRSGSNSAGGRLLAQVCNDAVRFASNLKAWGLTADPASWGYLVLITDNCKNFKAITVEDRTTVYGIAPAADITSSPSTLPVEPLAGASGSKVFDGYGAPTGSVVRSELFGLHAPVGYGNPGVTPGYVRIWDSDASWRDLEPEKGTYRWDTLSASIDNSMGAKVMYVLGNTPEWAGGGKDGANPPESLDDAANFIGKVCERFGSRISSYEVWNEGNLLTFWSNGNMAQLAELTQKVRDKVRACGSGAEVVASSAGARADGGFATRYMAYLYALASRGWPVDAYSVHSYPSASGGPEQRLQELAQFKSMLALVGAPQKPIYDTELNYGLGGLGEGRRPIDDATGAGYLAQTYVQSVQYGVDSAFWYLWTRSDYDLLGMQFNSGTTQTKQAWNSLRSWLIGSTMQRCSGTDKIRGCQFSSPGGNFSVFWSADGSPQDVDVTGLGSTCLSLQWGACEMPSATTVRVGGQPVRIN